MASDASDYSAAPPRPGDCAKTPSKEKRATYQDVLDAPPNMVAEVVGGALYTHPRPAMPHAWAASGLGGTLSQPFNFGRGGPGGWWIVVEPELHLGEDIVVPDLAGWRRENMPEYPVAAYCSQAPDWACEVLSPSTCALDKGPKQAIYAREGVAHLWFVDPDARTLAAFSLRGGDYALIGERAGDDPVSLPPFDAIGFSLGDLWPPARKP